MAHDLRAQVSSVHGYSLLRPTINADYFNDLYDVAVSFGIEVEGHRGFAELLGKMVLI